MDEYVQTITMSLDGRVRVPAITLYDIGICGGKFLQFLVDNRDFREYYWHTGRISAKTNIDNTVAVMRTWNHDIISRYFSMDGGLTNITCKASIPLSYGPKQSWLLIKCYKHNVRTILASLAENIPICELNGRLSSVGFVHQISTEREHHFKYQNGKNN